MTTKITINKSVVTSLCMILRIIRAASGNPVRLAMVLESVQELAKPLPDSYRLNDFIAQEAASLAIYLMNRPVPEGNRREVIDIILSERSHPLSVTASQGWQHETE